MSSVYENPTSGKISSGFSPYYPSDPNQNYTYVQDAAQLQSEGLYRTTTVGKMMVDALTRYVIGKGLTPMAAPETEILGWTPEQTDAFQRQAEAYWRLVTDTVNFDYYGKDNFKQLQRIAFKNILIAGDTLRHNGYRKLKSGTVVPYVQVISGRMVSQVTEQDTKKSQGGVVLDKTTGREVAYKIRVIDDLLVDQFTYRTVRRYNSLGRLEFDLIQIDKSDPQLTRGIPLLTAIRDDILDLNKFKSNHLLQSAVQALFTAFIEKDLNTEEGGTSFLDKINSAGAESVNDDGERRVDMGAGYVVELNPGEKVSMAERHTDGDDYDAYLKANIGMIASALGMSYEVAMNTFNASFSASRAGLNAAEKNFQILRDEFCTKFNNPVWRMVIEHGILTGMIEAPGWEKGGLYRDAIFSVSWTGVTPPQVDPTKEVNAYTTAIDKGLITREYATRQLYGLDYDEVHERWMKEMEDMPQAEPQGDAQAEEEDEDGQDQT
jgi:lambda family phage portal protein